MFKHPKFYFNFIPLILVSIILVKFIFNIENIFSTIVLSVFSVLVPFFWALGIAYLINPLMVWIEKKFKFRRGISTLISYIIVVFFIYIVITVIFPTILNSLIDLFKNMSDYASTAENWISNAIANMNTQIEPSHIQTSAMEIFSKVTSITTTVLGNILTQTIKITSSFVKLIFGFIISIYMLLDKENLINSCKKIIIALLPSENKAEDFLCFMSEANGVFGRFIIGKTIDSLIIGILCYIGLIIIQAPFAALIALIVGITNMIPYFGPFIGMVPAFILTLFVKPSMAIWVLFFIFLLQQFDGCYLGPKILGEKVGVSPLFIILAVTIGGGLFGVLGMFLSVPIIALMKIYGEKYLEFKLKHKSSGIKKFIE